MVNLKIDNKEICVPEGTTIMDAAAQNGIIIPKLCYLKDINEIAACRVCVVEMEGKDRLITSCNNTVQEGMVLYTNSPKVRADRRNTVQLILSQHDCKCATCVRSGNCSLQKIAIRRAYRTPAMEQGFPADSGFRKMYQMYALYPDL